MHFLASMNALAEYFAEGKREKYRFYVVFQGLQPGVYSSWIEVVEQIQNFQKPLYKRYNNLKEALDQARNRIGLNFYISPCLRSSQEPLEFHTVHSTNKILFVIIVRH